MEILLEMELEFKTQLIISIFVKVVIWLQFFKTWKSAVHTRCIRLQVAVFYYK